MRQDSSGGRWRRLRARSREPVAEGTDRELDGILKLDPALLCPSFQALEDLAIEVQPVEHHEPATEGLRHTHRVFPIGRNTLLVA